MRNHLGDIVTMPLPTQWAPSPRRGLPPGGVPSGFTQGLPGTIPIGNQPGGGFGPGLVPGVDPVTGLRIPGSATEPITDPGAWRPELVLPDSMLPPALRRDNPLVTGRIVYAPNRWDLSLMNKARMWEWIQNHGGLRSCCRVPELGPPIWDQPPWQVMPSNGLEYRYPFSGTLASISGGPPFDGSDTVIGSWRVQAGFDGVINHFICGFTGDGFLDFSGDIVWRVLVDNRYVKNLGNVTNTYGDFATQMLIPGYGWRLISGQTVSVIVAIANGASVSDGIVTAGLFGWTYPRR